MASSGTINGTRSGTRPYLRIQWTITEQDISNNRSRVRLRLYLVSTHKISFTASKSGILQGTSFTYSGGMTAPGTKLLREQSIWVTHNSDGSKTQSLSASFNISITWSGSSLSSLSVSGSANLNTIPRKSDLTSGSITALQASSNASLSIGRDVKYTGFYHLVSILDGSTWVWDTGYFKGSPATSYTVPSVTVNKMLERMGSVVSKTFRVRLRTYTGSNGSGYIGESIRNLTVNVHSSVTPTITSKTISEYVSGLNAQFGAYVQNKSRLSLAMNANAGYGASVRSYRIVANGTTYTARIATTGELKNSGSQTITFEVTDSRGRKATATNTINVIAYSPPRINNLTAERANSSGTIDDEGTHALIKYNVAISPVGNKNTKSFILRYRQNGTDSWQSITLANTNYSYNTSRVIGPLNVDYAFDVQLVVKDYFDEILLTEIVQSTFTLINFASNKRGLAFGATYNEATGGIVQIDGHLVPYFTEVEEW